MAKRGRGALAAIVSLALACVSFAAGCQDENPSPAGNSDAVADASGDTTADSAVDAASADASDLFVLTGSNTDVARNPSCDKFDDGVYGKKLPWTGWQGGGKTFSCNTCRGGYQNLQGSWRFIDFKTEDPSTPLGKGYKETLKFDGNTLVNRLFEIDAGKATDQTIDGWYFCTDAAELKSKDAIFVLERAQPNGAFGNSSGDFLRVSVKVNAADANLIALGISSGLDGKLIGEYLYCKVGSTIAGKPCSDPFGG